MTYPMEHKHSHDWELDGNSSNPVNVADAFDQASQGKRTESPTQYEWYICSDCGAKATKWLDGTFPELKGKYVFNPSGGTWTGTLGNGWPCELNVKFQKFGKAAEEYLDSIKGLDNDYLITRFRKRCVHFIMQAWVDKCDHPEEYIEPRGMKYGKGLCSKCGGIYYGERDGEDWWLSDWCLHEKSLNGHIGQHLKALESIKNEET